MKLCSRFLMFLSKFMQKRQIWVSEPHFGEARDDAWPWLMTRWKAHDRLSIGVYWTFRYLLWLRSYEAKCVQLGCFRRGSTPLHSNFPGRGRPLSTILGVRKLRDTGLPEGEGHIPLRSVVLADRCKNWHCTIAFVVILITLPSQHFIILST